MDLEHGFLATIGVILSVKSIMFNVKQLSKQYYGIRYLYIC
jgi:hypothetical protein